MNNSSPILRIGFTGDISFSGRFAQKILRSADVGTMFDAQIAEFLAGNDWNIGNIEGALTRCGFQKRSGVALRSPPEAAELLKRLNINCYNLANNHAMDCGLDGLEDTFRLAHQHGAICLGAGRDIDQASRPVIFEQSGIRIGLLAVAHNEGMIAGTKQAGVFAERYDELIRDRIAAMRAECDWVVLVYHGGEEYIFVPSPLRRAKLFKYLEYGVDIIVCHHPHVVQGYEQPGNRRIFYSLGNFIFDIPGHTSYQSTDASVLISLFFDKKHYDVSSLCTHSDLVSGRIEKGSVCRTFAAINADDYKDAWRQEAWRFVRNSFSVGKPQQASGLTSVGFGRFLTKIRRILGIIRRLNNPNSRCIYASACRYKLDRMLYRL